MAFLGDVLLGGDAEETLRREGYGYPLAEVRPALAGADLVVANLEGPITDAPAAGRPGRADWSYRADAASLEALAEAGVGLVSLANNHILDSGPQGLSDTLDALAATGIAHCGAGPTDAEARRPAVVDVGGVRVGFLSAMAPYDLYVEAGVYAAPDRPGPALLDDERVGDELAALRGDADVCVVLPHWGRTYRPVTGHQRATGRVLRAAGADLVVGHHPHVVHPVNMKDRCPILFSLGNGAFGTRGSFARHGAAPFGLLATAELEAGAGVTTLELRLLHVDNRVVNYRTRLVKSIEYLLSVVDDHTHWEVIDDAVRWQR